MTSEMFVKLFLSIFSIIMSLVGIYVIPVLKTSKYHKEFE